MVAKDNFYAFKGRHFYKLCYATMTDWQKLIVDEITSKNHEEISEGDLKMAYKNRTGGQGRLPQPTKIEKFVVKLTMAWMASGMYSFGVADTPPQRRWPGIVLIVKPTAIPKLLDPPFSAR